MNKIVTCEIDETEIKAALAYWIEMTYAITVKPGELNLKYIPAHAQSQAGTSGFFSVTTEIK